MSVPRLGLGQECPGYRKVVASESQAILPAPCFFQEPVPIAAFLFHVLKLQQEVVGGCTSIRTQFSHLQSSAL